MRSVDTNVLVRLVVRDDANQTTAAEAFVAGGAWISHLVLLETSWVLTSVYERSPQQLAAAIDRLLDHRDLVVQDADVVRSALHTFKRRPSLGLPDCLVVEVARRAGHLPMGTFDRDVAKLEGVQRL